MSDELVRDRQVQLSDLSGCVLQFRTEAGREWNRRGGNGGLGGEWTKETRGVKMVVTIVFGLEHWFIGYDLRGYDTRGGVFGTGLIRQWEVMCRTASREGYDTRMGWDKRSGNGDATVYAPPTSIERTNATRERPSKLSGCQIAALAKVAAPLLPGRLDLDCTPAKGVDFLSVVQNWLAGMA